MRGKWYYGTEENLKGPFTKAEIHGMIDRRSIFPQTLLWLEYEDNKTKQITKKSYPAIKTQFGAFFLPQELTEAAMDSKVRNYWLWQGAFSSIIPVIVLYYLYFGGWNPYLFHSRGGQELSLFANMWIYMLLSMMLTIFLSWDWFLMVQKGYQPVLHEIFCVAFFLSPVYCFLRNKRLGHRQTSALLSLACWLLTIGVYFSFPFYTNAEITRREMRFANNLLSAMRPEVTAEWVSVSVQRLPGLKFEVVNHLSNGGSLGKTLEQSGWNLNLADPGLKISVPNTEDGMAFIKKFEEIMANTRN